MSRLFFAPSTVRTAARLKMFGIWDSGTGDQDLEIEI
jgi:hypothetical protein